MTTNNDSIKITNETREKLSTDLSLVPKFSHIAVDDVISRAQAFPEEHLLDILYKDGMRRAMKTLISYYAFPMVDYGEEYPMHTGFLKVFDFCGNMVACSSDDVSDVDEYALNRVSSNISWRVGVMRFPGKEEFYGVDFKEKKDLLNLLNVLRKHWSEDLVEENMFWMLISILDFPAIKFADDAATRTNFAVWLENLTAFWPETVWNWNDFGF